MTRIGHLSRILFALPAFAFAATPAVAQFTVDTTNVDRTNATTTMINNQNRTMDAIRNADALRHQIQASYGGGYAGIQQVTAQPYHYDGTATFADASLPKQTLFLGVDNLTKPEFGGYMFAETGLNTRGSFGGAVTGFRSNGICHIHVNFASGRSPSDFTGPCSGRTLSGTFVASGGPKDLTGAYHFHPDPSMAHQYLPGDK